jgi:head-tail adaptor
MAVRKRHFRAGDLTHKITVQQCNESIDAGTGQLIKGYSPMRTTWASVGYVGSPSAGSSEEDLNGQRTGKMKIEFMFRFFPNLRFNDRIQFNGGWFEIYSIQIVGRNQAYVVRAELRDDQSNESPTGATYIQGFG